MSVWGERLLSWRAGVRVLAEQKGVLVGVAAVGVVRL